MISALWTRRPALPVAATLLAATLVTTACIQTHGGKDGANGGGAVLANIAGMSDDDLKLPGLGYHLICDHDTAVEGQVTKVGDQEVVSFPASQVKDGYVCSMDIKATIDDDSAYTWFGYQDGKPVKNLLYGSDRATVADKKLKLQLYKLYSVREAEVFSIVVNVDFALDGAAAMPPEDKTSASLVCSATETYPGTYKAGAGKLATLTFGNLPVKSFAAKACNQIIVLVDKTRAFAGDAPQIVLKDPKKADAPHFPDGKDDTKTITMKPSTGDGNVSVDTVNAGACFTYDAALKKCNDHLAVAFDEPKTFFVAKVQGKTKAGQGEPVTYYVAPGEDGVRLFAGAKLTTADLNAAVAKTATDDLKKAFHFYKETIADSVAKLKTDDELPADLFIGGTFDGAKVSRDELADVQFLSFAVVWVHGFHKIDEAALNAKPSAYWLAALKATKDALPAQDFLVAGDEKYFHSAKAPIAGAYFTTAQLLLDLDVTTPPARWRFYALQGAALSDAATCKIAFADLIAAASAKTSAQLKIAAEADADPALDPCSVTTDKLKAVPISDYKFEAPRFWAWDWYTAAL